jgi:hypothetical protein
MSRRETGPAPRELIIAIAKAFRLTMPSSASLRPQWLKDLAVVAGVLKSYNASFLREQFFRDAGVEDHKKGEEKS